LSLRTNLAVCLALAGALACCLRTGGQTLNTSGNILVGGQPVVITSPKIIIWHADTLTVPTNGYVIGELPSYAGAEYTDPEPPSIVPRTIQFQISTNGGATWKFTSSYPSNCLVRISTYSEWSPTNINIFGYSHRFGVTNFMAGQTILVDTPTTPNAAVNRQYVDRQIEVEKPWDWSEFDAVSEIKLRGNTVFHDSAWQTVSRTNEDLAVHALRAYGADVMVFSTTSAATGSNVLSKISVTDTTVTISIPTNGIATKPTVYWSPEFLTVPWTLVSSVATVTESYPDAVGTNYTVSFPRIDGANFFTVWLESESAERTLDLYVTEATVHGAFAVVGWEADFGGGFYSSDDGIFMNGGSVKVDATGDIVIRGTGQFYGNGGGLTNLFSQTYAVPLRSCYVQNVTASYSDSPYYFSSGVRFPTNSLGLLAITPSHLSGPVSNYVLTTLWTAYSSTGYPFTNTLTAACTLFRPGVGRVLNYQQKTTNLVFNAAADILTNVVVFNTSTNVDKEFSLSLPINYKVNGPQYYWLVRAWLTEVPNEN